MGSIATYRQAGRPGTVLKRAPRADFQAVSLNDFGDTFAGLEGDRSLELRGGEVEQTTKATAHLRSKHNAELESLRSELQSRCADQLEQQRAEFEAALRELELKHSNELKAISAHQESLFSRLGENVADFYSASEVELVELACNVAEAVLDRPLFDEDRRIAAESLAWAMEQLAGDGHLDIHLSEQFARDLDEHSLMPNVEVPSLVRWHRGPLADGDFVVASPSSSIRRIRTEAVQRAIAEIRGGISDD